MTENKSNIVEPTKNLLKFSKYTWSLLEII